MIQELSRWAANNWHVLQSRAVVLGVVGRVGGPARLLDLEGTLFLSFIEGVLRDSEHHNKALDEMYAAARPVVSTPLDRRDRRAEIARVTRLFGG